MTKKKKILLLSTMMVLLVVTAVCNFIFTGDTVTSTLDSVTTTSNYFTQRRTERSTSRNEEILQLNEIIQNENSTEATKNDALKLKKDIAKNCENELLLETLIKSYGFEDVVVIMGVDSENVNVVVKDENLTEEESIAIYTIIKEEVNKSPDKVKIIAIS